MTRETIASSYIDLRNPSLLWIDRIPDSSKNNDAWTFLLFFAWTLNVLTVVNLRILTCVVKVEGRSLSLRFISIKVNWLKCNSLLTMWLSSLLSSEWGPVFHFTILSRIKSGKWIIIKHVKECMIPYVFEAVRGKPYMNFLRTAVNYKSELM